MGSEAMGTCLRMNDYEFLVALVAITAATLGFATGKPEVKEWTVPFLNALTGPIASIGEYLDWGAQQAAREACRIAVLQSTAKPYTSANGPVMTKIKQIMTAAGVKTYNASMVQITEDTAANPAVSLTITVPYKDVKLTGFLKVITKNIAGSCSMRKEGV